MDEHLDFLGVLKQIVVWFKFELALGFGGCIADAPTGRKDGILSSSLSRDKARNQEKQQTNAVPPS